MKTRNKVLIAVGIILLILIISAGVYFSWFYEPRNVYDVVWDNEEDISMEVEEVGEKDINDLKESEVAEVKKELTVQEIIREIEKEKPKFNLTIQPNLVAEYKDYTELKEANIEKVMVKLTPNDEIYPKTTQLTKKDVERLQGYDVIERGTYIGFEGFDKERAKGWISKINPISFPHYENAKVEWITDPELVYKTAISQTGIRGVLRIQYFEEENRFKVEPNKVFEIDTEIVVSNTDNYDNTISMKLNEICYLSNLREVE